MMEEYENENKNFKLTTLKRQEWRVKKNKNKNIYEIIIIII